MRIEAVIRSILDEVEDLPDHLRNAAIRQAQLIDQEPNCLPVELIIKSTAFERRLAALERALENVHDELRWLDETLPGLVPGYQAPDPELPDDDGEYLAPDQDEDEEDDL